MEKEFVSYELALKLKELGFDEECLGSYTIKDNSLQIVDSTNLPSVVKAPLWQQAFDWFRNEHKLHSVFHVYNDFTFDYGVCNLEGLYSTKIASQTNFKTYEEARLKCLGKLIELISKK